MFLEQINRSLTRKAQKMLETSIAPRVRKTPTPRNDGAKTVGIAVPPAVYTRLMLLKERRQLASIKEALLLAAQAGLDQLGV